jgi:hypothetical protein
VIAKSGEVSVNFTMDRDAHRRLVVTAKVLGISMKAALIEGARMFVDANSAAVTKVLRKPAPPRGDSE